VSFVESAQEIAALEGALKGVLRDMDTLANGMKKAQADELSARELYNKLLRKCDPLQGQKQDLEERIARAKALREQQRSAQAAVTARMDDFVDEAHAMNSAFEWEKKNGGFATFSTAPIPVQRSADARR